MKATGFFWVYYNTRKGRKPAYTEEYELWEKSPWVIKRFASKEQAFHRGPRSNEAPFHDIFAQTVTIRGTCTTVYIPDPPWKEARADSIHYVRGYMVVEGEIEWT